MINESKSNYYQQCSLIIKLYLEVNLIHTFKLKSRALFMSKAENALFSAILLARELLFVSSKWLFFSTF